LLSYENVVLTPRVAAQPRFNALDDIHDLVVGLAAALRGDLTTPQPVGG
jgi:hypothetical protein